MLTKQATRLSTAPEPEFRPEKAQFQEKFEIINDN
jgi:hypothetical protein